jgi:hypothetical protein
VTGPARPGPARIGSTGLGIGWAAPGRRGSNTEGRDDGGAFPETCRSAD